MKCCVRRCVLSFRVSGLRNSQYVRQSDLHSYKSFIIIKLAPRFTIKKDARCTLILIIGFDLRRTDSLISRSSQWCGARSPWSQQHWGTTARTSMRSSSKVCASVRFRIRPASLPCQTALTVGVLTLCVCVCRCVWDSTRPSAVSDASESHWTVF